MPRIKIEALGIHAPQLASVRDLRSKEGRREQGRFAVEGHTLFAEARAAGWIPEAVYLTDRALSAASEDYDEFAPGPAWLLAERAMERLSTLESPPGLLAVFPMRLGTLADVFADGEPIAILAGIADPGNAGTLLRSAEIFGIRSVAFSSDAVEPYNPKVVRGSMGAIFRQCLAVADGPAIVKAAEKEGYDLIAAAGDGQALREVEFRRRTAIAIGNERRGVDSSLGPCGRRVAVEQRGEGESLNAAIAGSIIFYEFSQRAKS